MQFLEGCGKPFLCNKNTHDTLFSTASLKCKAGSIKKKKMAVLKLLILNVLSFPKFFTWSNKNILFEYAKKKKEKIECNHLVDRKKM